MDGGKPTSAISNPGLAALIMLLRFQGVGADPEQIDHQFGGIPIGVPEMLRCAKGFGLKARSVTTKWERLAGMPLPGIAPCATALASPDASVGGPTAKSGAPARRIDSGGPWR